MGVRGGRGSRRMCGVYRVRDDGPCRYPSLQTSPLNLNMLHIAELNSSNGVHKKTFSDLCIFKIIDYNE